jgi:hypothetical protein
VRWAARNYGIEQVKNALAAWVSAPVTVKTDTAPEGSPTFLFIEVDDQGR